MRKRARQIQGALADVNPMTIEEWEAAFRAQPDPDQEMLFWLEVAHRYRQTRAADPNMPLKDRQRCLHALVTG